MTSSETLQTTHKEVTKLVFGIFLILIAISCYLLQRSYVSIFLAEYIDTEFADETFQNQQQSQVSFGALKFQYGAMNIFWPLIILVLILVLKFLIKKQSSIWGELKIQNSSNSLNFDPYNIYEQILDDKTGRAVLRLSSYLPVIALVSHFFAGVWLFYMIGFEDVANSNAIYILIPETFLHIIITFVCILFVFKIPKFLISSIRTYGTG